MLVKRLPFRWAFSFFAVGVIFFDHFLLVTEKRISGFGSVKKSLL
jgi:hypothetical protein